MLKQRSVRGTRKRVAQFLGAGREFIDLLAKRHEDPAESAKFLDLTPESEADERIFDPEDDERAEEELRHFTAAEQAATSGRSSTTAERKRVPQANLPAVRREEPRTPEPERPRAIPTYQPKTAHKPDVHRFSEPRRPRRDTGSLRISIDD